MLIICHTREKTKRFAKCPTALQSHRSDAQGKRNSSTVSLSFGLGPGREVQFNPHLQVQHIKHALSLKDNIFLKDIL